MGFITNQAGKKLLLITNSDYHYTDKMMKHSFNRFLPNDMGWQDLFDIVSRIHLFLSVSKLSYSHDSIYSLPPVEN